MNMLNIYLLFPQTGDDILDIIQDENSYKQFVKDVLESISILQKEDSLRLFYDSENIKAFIEACSSFESESYLSNAENQIRNFISIKSVAIQNQLSKDNSCVYVVWNYNNLLQVEYAPEIVAEIAEKIFSYSNEEFILLNISENIKADRNVLLVCKDAKHILDLPKFARIPFVTDKSDLELWLSTKYVTAFSLLDRNRFTRTNLKAQGQRIYQENGTNYYWYLDNFHKAHYEIFDSTGKQHIGEADLEGKLDISQCDNTKKPIDI